MSIESLLIAAQYLDYKAETEARGEEPQDYNSFLNEASGVECLSLSSSEHENIGDNVEIVETKFNHGKPSLKGNIHEKSISREVHNRLEKNRRAQMKEGFERLKQLTPNIGTGKVSNLKLLREVTRYIKELKEQHEANLSEVRQLEMRYVALLAKRQYLCNQSRTPDAPVNGTYMNGCKELSPEREEVKKNIPAEGDEAALLFFSRVAASAGELPNGYCSTASNDVSPFREGAHSVGVIKSPVGGVKSEAKSSEQAGWSASEKLMAICAAGKNAIGTENSKDVNTAFRRCTKLKRASPEMKAPSESMNSPPENPCDDSKSSAQTAKYFGKCINHLKTEHNAHESSPPIQQAMPTTGLKRKHTEECSRPSGLTTENAVEDSLRVAMGIKAFPCSQAKICAPPSVIMQAASVNKNQTNGSNSILQKVLLNNEPAQSEKFLAKPTALVVRSDNSTDQRSILHCAAPVTQNTVGKPPVTEVAKVHFPVVQIQNARKSLGKPLDNENDVKMVDRTITAKELPAAVQGKGNTGIVKFASATGGVLKPGVPESFRAIRVSPPHHPPPTLPVTQASVQTSNKVRPKPEKNDSMVYLVAVPNSGQKLYINGSAV